jgi:hypothetical protein
MSGEDNYIPTLKEFNGTILLIQEKGVLRVIMMKYFYFPQIFTNSH